MSDEAELFRRWGYLQAALDPLGRLPPLPHPELDRFPRSPWRKLYCGSLGLEFLHLSDPRRVEWLRARMETEPPPPDRPRLLELLVRAELFERALQTRYPGTKRYSIEGVSAVVPLLDTLLETFSAGGAAQAMIGMSHRGRLNVIVQIVGRAPRDVFAGFEDADPRSVFGGGDVKYHQGASADLEIGGRKLHVCLSSNPSHLEAVDPVVLGRARARQARMGGVDRVVPIVLHGDAAFAGQGILAETLNLAELPGYHAGGTVQVIVNNLLGFTTAPPSLHSSRYASDVARRLAIPILHVNGEDPDAVVRAARLAAGYRAEFHSDVVVDLIGYRRHGHSEVEDPTTSQPRLYRALAKVPVLHESYAARSGLDPAPIVRRVQEEYRGELDAAKSVARPSLRLPAAWWLPYRGGAWEPGFEVETGVPRERLAGLAERLGAAPPGFQVHPKVAKLLEQRVAMGRGAQAVDWGAAEALAFASLLVDGTPVRLSGQDSRRGTFNQRHAVLVDIDSEATHAPLSALAPGQARFECWDSPLSEAAPLGFEYGFSRDFPEALVLWEAQFGDFANGAQVLLDQFIVASEDKWGALSGLVLLLPHGHEGQGPEHSGARVERFLQLAAEDNVQVCQPSTAAQYFHLLRRQALRRWRKPLIALTPKSLLRRPEALSPLDALAGGRFELVIGDDRRDATRVLLCSGKVAHDLREERRRRGDETTAIVALEQLYPFPETELAAELQRHYPAREIVWVQEEPGNMGAERFLLPYLAPLAQKRTVRTLHRTASASPATGSAKAHALEQQSLLNLAFAPPA